MLPSPHRLRLSSDFRAVMRGGVRAGRPCCVVHALAHEPDVERTTGPRFGLVVSKAVGNSVVRHRMSRRLRHICAELASGEYFDIDFVVRALPPAVEADSELLRSQVIGAAERAAQKARRRLPDAAGAGSALEVPEAASAPQAGSAPKRA